MEQAIKKAMEGGYKNNIIHNWDMFKPDVQRIRFNGFLLDPLFWQCLAKAEGWGDSVGYGIGKAWQLNWHRFLDWIADGKDIDSFFKQLLK